MQVKILDNGNKIDSYSALICGKYLKTEQDFIDLICVNSKFKETTEKFRYNPISIKSLKSFPKIQTQHLYKKGDKMLKRKQIIKYEIWYDMDYKEYTQYRKRTNVKFHRVEYTQKKQKKYGEKIPDCVTLLSSDCFHGSYSLSTINLPSSLTSIGDWCYSGCSKISSINLPSSLTSLGYGCFYGCSKLSSINLPNSLISLGDNWFSYCLSLSTINIPSSLTSISNKCFYGCLLLLSISLQSSLKSIGDYCFSGCSTLSSINLPSSLTLFGENCFYGCSRLKGVINVPNYCFDA